MELENKATMKSEKRSAKSWELFSVVIHSEQIEMCHIVLRAEEIHGFIEKGQ